MKSPSGTRPALVLMVLLLFATQACTDIFLPGLPAIATTFDATMQTANLTISAYNYSQAAVLRESASSAEMALLWRRRSPRWASLSVRLALARACCTWASSWRTVAWNGRGSIWNSKSPFFTRAPSVKAT